jgi:hypothetical protein
LIVGEHGLLDEVKKQAKAFVLYFSLFVCILLVAALNNCFSISARTEVFRIAEFRGMKAGLVIDIAILESGRGVIFRLSQRGF